MPFAGSSASEDAALREHQAIGQRLELLGDRVRDRRARRSAAWIAALPIISVTRLE